MQESFAALAVTLRSAPPRELRPWLARVARNAAIDAGRRRRARINGDGEMPDVARLSTEDLSASHEVKHDFASLLGALRELPESQRTALLMRELAGHSYREIGELLEIDDAAVRGLIARARVGLRAQRQATELPCSAARAAIAAEPDGRRHDKTVRRHVRGCASCRAYRHALRGDARALRGIVAVAPTSGDGGRWRGRRDRGEGRAARRRGDAGDGGVCGLGVCGRRNRVAVAGLGGAPPRGGRPRCRFRAWLAQAPPVAGRSAWILSPVPATRTPWTPRSSNAGASSCTRARTSAAVARQSQLSVAYTGASTTGTVATGTGGQHGSGGVPSSSPPQPVARAGPGGGSSTHRGSPAGVPEGVGASGSGPASSTPGPGPSSGSKGGWPAAPTGTGSTQPHAEVRDRGRRLDSRPAATHRHTSSGS